MRARTSKIIFSIAPFILAGIVPAVATSVTPTTLTILAGSLSISAPSGTVNLGTISASGLVQVVVGSLGEVQVADNRNAVAGSGWVASVISTAFTPAVGPAIAATYVSYSAGTIATVGTVTAVDNEPLSLSGVAPAVTATGITGINSATWSPDITINVPAGMVAGTYYATITHSIT